MFPFEVDRQLLKPVAKKGILILEKHKMRKVTNIMFRPIRRKKNELGREDSIKLLCEARRGVLAVNGDDGYPYAIPVNYLYPESVKFS